MIIELNKENFDSEIIGCGRPVLVKFYAETGCLPCTNFKPIYEKFAEAHPEIKCCAVGKPTLRDPQGEIEAKLDVKVYPTTIAIIDGSVIKKETGILTPEQMLNMVKTIYNISNDELDSAITDTQIAFLQMKKELKAKETYLNALINEMNRRMTPPVIEDCQTECEAKCETKDEACVTSCREYCSHVMVQK